jgi:uncharacterized membrane protein YqjE
MEASTTSSHRLTTATRVFARRLLAIGENRLELLAVEAQEEREHLLRAFLMALGVAALALLSCMAFTAAIVVCFWSWSPPGILLILTLLYAAAAVWLCRRLATSTRDREAFAASLDQLRKDRASLEKALA